MRLLAALVALATLTAPVDAAQRVLLARGQWAALQSQDGRHCQAAARSLHDAPKGAEQARATFAFDAFGPRHGEFHVRLSRIARPGSSVILSIGDQPFQLVGRGPRAWSIGPTQEAAIIAAARVASGMRVEARDASGRRFIDRYLLAGAPSAIDAAAVGCASSLVKSANRD
ncbi:MAG TPA: hypothetical protein VK485_04380 [Sphingomicrobium sp.]|nr:hypothetical protein [Sphingomicrobium sp.]